MAFPAVLHVLVLLDCSPSFLQRVKGPAGQCTLVHRVLDVDRHNAKLWTLKRVVVPVVCGVVDGLVRNDSMFGHANVVVE